LELKQTKKKSRFFLCQEKGCTIIHATRCLPSNKKIVFSSILSSSFIILSSSCSFSLSFYSRDLMCVGGSSSTFVSVGLFFFNNGKIDNLIKSSVMKSFFFKKKEYNLFLTCFISSTTAISAVRDLVGGGTYFSDGSVTHS